MILKKLQRTNLSKTKAAMISGLVDYVLAQKDEEGKQKRLYAYGMNFLTTTTAAWKQEMIALSEESIKSRMPVSHWAMSWQENEIPSHEQVQEAVNIFLERMGLHREIGHIFILPRARHPPAPALPEHDGEKAGAAQQGGAQQRIRRIVDDHLSCHA